MTQNQETNPVFTAAQLQAALGSGFDVDEWPDGALRLSTNYNVDVSIDPASTPPSMAVTLTVQWHPEPLEDDCDDDLRDKMEQEALAAIDTNLRTAWEDAGFNIPDGGDFTTYWHMNAHEKRFVMFEVEATKDITSLRDAVQTLNAIDGLDSRTWV